MLHACFEKVPLARPKLVITLRTTKDASLILETTVWIECACSEVVIRVLSSSSRSVKYIYTDRVRFLGPGEITRTLLVPLIGDIWSLIVGT